MRCLYHLTKDGVCILRCYSLDSIAELPSKIEGKPVTELGAYAFSDHFSMEDYEKENAHALEYGVGKIPGSFGIRICRT